MSVYTKKEKLALEQQEWITTTQPKPPVHWDGNTKTFSIVLSGMSGLREKDTLEAEWKPPITYIVRIREPNGGRWSIGFETPLTGCGFVDLRPDTEYEVEVRSKNSSGESKPARVRVRTSREGTLVV